jgi:gamma-glutamylcyclotransferase (GGCT)/AIG2-like uncharacterized protein YtfP
MAHDIALFVYGSLKLGFRHAAMLAGAQRAGAASAAPYTLVRYRDYPAMVPAAYGTVHGELAFVDRGLLAALDEFEGCPSLYQRRSIRVADGRWAQAYLISAEVARANTPLPGGVWRER